MKRKFKLTHPKIKAARLADAIKHDLKKHFKKERAKEVVDGAPFWDFDVYTGSSDENSIAIAITEINHYIDSAVERGDESIYFKIIPKPGKHKSALTKNIGGTSQ